MLDPDTAIQAIRVQLEAALAAFDLTNQQLSFHPRGSDDYHLVYLAVCEWAQRKDLTVEECVIGETPHTVEVTYFKRGDDHIVSVHRPKECHRTKPAWRNPDTAWSPSQGVAQ
jgi:hypothetical protein